MGTGENEVLVPRGRVLGHTAVPVSGGADDTDRQRHRRPQQQQQQPDLRKLLLPLMLTLGIFGVSTGAARFLFPRKKIQRQQPLQKPQQSQHQTLASKLGANRNPYHFVREGDGPLTTECASADKVVLQGYDLTSYFALEASGTPVQGVAEHTSEYNGYTFWFASAENQAQFEERPLSYIPAWGGFCSWGISNEDWWSKDTLGPDADPNRWMITDDGHLHFFRSELPMSKFLGDVPGNVQLGNAVWHGWWGSSDPGAYRFEGSPLNTDCFCSIDTCEDN